MTFKKIYLIFLSACILLSAIFLIYVGIVVKDFDKSQPEHLVKQHMEWIDSCAKDGTLADELELEKHCTNRYENNDADYYIKSYLEKVNSGEITYEYIAAESNDLSKKYNILSGQTTIGTLSLSGKNSRSRLFFFNMADWSIDDFTPAPADTVYNLQLYVPEGTEVFINGVKPTAEELDTSDSVPVYNVKGLLHEPVIEYKSSNGKALRFTGEKNVIKPAVYDYELIIPSGISVSVNGQTISGEASADNKMVYTILEMNKPTVTFTDAFGKSKEYNGEGAPEFFTCNVAVPENYTLTIEGKDADSVFKPTVAAHPDSAVLLEQAGVNLPNQKTYAVSAIDEGVKAVVADDKGNKKEYTLNTSKLELNSLGNDTIPEEIASQIDIMEVAKNWSKFMTDDLPGETHGLYTVRKYFIKDSDYYRYAYQWATGIDITFTSVHTLDSFTNEKISNFTQYNDKCFSCEVYFEKNMTLYRDYAFAGNRTDVFNSVMYFVYVDDTPDNGVDDPHWAIAVMHDVV